MSFKSMTTSLKKAWIVNGDKNTKHLDAGS